MVRVCIIYGLMLCMTYNMFYYIGRRALADITNQGGEAMDTREGQFVRTSDC